MVTWNLSQIISKVRNVTGTPDSEQLTDAQITDYINTYYGFTMPFELKEQINLQPLTFNAFPNQDQYPQATGGVFQTDQPMAYADGFPLIFYQDRDIFFQDWPQQYTSDNVATGTGSAATTYTGTTQAFPILSGSFEITDGTQVASDPTGSGILTGDVNPAGTNTINYLTGAFSVQFLSAVATTSTIYDKYQAYNPARPQGILFYNNTFTLRPVPDQVYVMTLQGFINQVQLSSATPGVTDLPLQTEWGQLIAYGASIEIFSDRGDLAAYNNFYPLLKRYENVALGRTVAQYDNSQSVPRF